MMRKRENERTSRLLKCNRKLSFSNCIMLARLRVGKCIFNTKLYFERTDLPKCTNYDEILTVALILITNEDGWIAGRDT